MLMRVWNKLPVSHWIGTASAKNTLPALLTTAIFWTGTLQAQTITTSPVAVAPVAALPVPMGQPLTWLLLGLALVGSLGWLLRRMEVQPSHLRQWALGGAMLVLGASTLWGDAVRAQLQLLQGAFTQASGETLDIPLHAVTNADVVTGFVPVEFANSTAVLLRIKDIAAPTVAACFPAGVPLAPVASAFTPTSAPCATGLTVAAGQTCWVDTAALCAAAASGVQGVAPSLLVDDSATINEGASTSGNVLSNDRDADGPLLVASYTLDGNRYLAGQAASNASLSHWALHADGSYQVTAAVPGTASPVPIHYTTQTGATAVLVLTINRTPVAINDNQVLALNTPASIAVLANDSDPDGDVLTVTSVTQSLNGLVAINPVSGELLYTPNIGYAGTDSFTYTVTDGKGGSATATVTVTVVAPICGNGVTESPEQCDDGNSINGDGCSTTCMIETPATPIQALGLARPTQRKRIALP